MTTQKETLIALIRATRDAYGCLVNADTDADGTVLGPIYESLAATYAQHGLNAGTAESSIDWYEGGRELLIESLTYELNRKGE